MFDTIVCGSDISSLVAALTSVMNGYKTILISEDPLTSRLDCSGFSFDPYPLPVTGFQQDGIACDIFTHLKLLPDTSLNDPSVQIIFPSHRIDLSHDADSTIQDICREFPDRILDIEKFVKHVHFTRSFISEHIARNPILHTKKISDFFRHIVSFIRLSTRKNALRKNYESLVEKNLSIDIMLKALLLHFSYLSPEEVFPLSLAYAFGAPLNGVFSAQFKNVSVTETLLERFSTLGGQHFSNCSINGWNFDHPISLSVSFEGNETAYSASRCILSTGSRLFSSLSTDSSLFSKHICKSALRNKRLYPFTLHLGLDERGLPDHLGSHSIIVSDTASPLINGNCVHLSLSGKNELNRAPHGKRTAHVTSFITVPPSRDSLNDIHLIADSMLSTLKLAIPFLTDITTFFDLDKSLQFCENHIHTTSVRMPLRRTSFFGLSLHQETLQKNLFLTGPLIAPALGYEGNVLSGFIAALLQGGNK